MRRCWTALVFAAWIVLGVDVHVALAQQPDPVGITMGFPTSVGVLWPLGAHFAIRPELSLSQATDSSTLAVSIGGPSFMESTSSDVTHLAVGVSALVYVRRWDALRAYISPRFAYSRTTSNDNSTPPLGLAALTMHEYSVAGSFGAQYSPVRHFGIFGEIGLQYSSSRTTSTVTVERLHTIATVSSAGVIFFF
jgi:hypothetical protein